MKSLVMLTVLMFCISALFIGCDQEIKRPVLQVITPPKNSLEEARAAMERVNQKRTEVYQRAGETGDFSIVFTASEVIFKEELGFRRGFWVDLVEIYRQENFENVSTLEELDNLQGAFAEKLEAGTLGMFYFQYIRSFDEIIIKYLRLSLEFPEKREEELLVLFRESISDGKTIIIFPQESS